MLSKNRNSVKTFKERMTGLPGHAAIWFKNVTKGSDYRLPGRNCGATQLSQLVEDDAVARKRAETALSAFENAFNAACQQKLREQAAEEQAAAKQDRLERATRQRREIREEKRVCTTRHV